MSLVWLFVLFGAGLFLASILRKQRTGTLSESGLAQRIFRQPERILLDIPIWLDGVEHPRQTEFLLEVEEELSTMGSLPSRRRFVRRLAEAIRQPSAASILRFTDTLLDGPPEFRDLMKSHTCEAALRFLKLLQVLCRNPERAARPGGKIGKLKRHLMAPPRSFFSVLDDGDERAVREWRRLFHLTYQVVAPKERPSSPKVRNVLVGTDRRQEALRELRLSTFSAGFAPFQDLGVVACSLWLKHQTSDRSRTRR